MNVQRLVDMANDIGQYFASEADEAAAAEQIAAHLRRFWAPAMRAQLSAHVAAGGEGLQAAVLLAVQRLQRTTTSGAT